MRPGNEGSNRASAPTPSRAGPSKGLDTARPEGYRGLTFPG